MSTRSDPKPNNKRNPNVRADSYLFAVSSNPVSDQLEPAILEEVEPASRSRSTSRSSTQWRLKKQHAIDVDAPSEPLLSNHESTRPQTQHRTHNAGVSSCRQVENCLFLVYSLAVAAFVIGYPLLLSSYFNCFASTAKTWDMTMNVQKNDTYATNLLTVILSQSSTSAYAWSAVFFSLILSWTSFNIGSRSVFGSAALVATIATAALPQTPFQIQGNVSRWIFLALRSAQGFGLAAAISMMATITGKLSKPGKRVLVTLLCSTCLQLAVQAHMIGAVVCQTRFLSWFVLHYAAGAMGLVSVVVWLIWYFSQYRGNAVFSNVLPQNTVEQPKAVNGSTISFSGQLSPSEIAKKSVAFDANVKGETHGWINEYAHRHHFFGPLVSTVLVTFGKIAVSIFLLLYSPLYISYATGFDTILSTYLSVIPISCLALSKLISALLLDKLKLHTMIYSSITQFVAVAAFFVLAFLPTKQPIAALAILGIGAAFLDFDSALIFDFVLHKILNVGEVLMGVVAAEYCILFLLLPYIIEARDSARERHVLVSNLLDIFDQSSTENGQQLEIDANLVFDRLYDWKTGLIFLSATLLISNAVFLAKLKLQDYHVQRREKKQRKLLLKQRQKLLEETCPASRKPTTPLRLDARVIRRTDNNSHPLQRAITPEKQ